MTREDLTNMPTSELLELIFKVIEPRCKELLYYTEADRLGGYDDDILSLYFSLKQGGYNDQG